MIKMIIWDFDGTLFDTYAGLAELMTRHYPAFADENKDLLSRKLYNSIENTLNHLFIKYSINPAEISNIIELEKKYGLTYIKPMPGINEILSSLRHSKIENVICSKRAIGIHKYLENYHILDCFSEIHTLTSGHSNKAELFKQILHKHRLNANEVIAIGDRESDILAANENNIFSCFFANNTCTCAKANITSLIELDQVVASRRNENH